MPPLAFFIPKSGKTYSLNFIKIYIDSERPDIMSTFFKSIAKKNRSLIKIIVEGDLCYEDSSKEDIIKITKELFKLISKNKFLTQLIVEDIEVYTKHDYKTELPPDFGIKQQQIAI